MKSNNAYLASKVYIQTLSMRPLPYFPSQCIQSRKDKTFYSVPSQITAQTGRVLSIYSKIPYSNTSSHTYDSSLSFVPMYNIIFVVDEKTQLGPKTHHHRKLSREAAILMQFLFSASPILTRIGAQKCECASREDAVDSLYTITLSASLTSSCSWRSSGAW